MQSDDNWQLHYPGLFDALRIERSIGAFRYCVMRRKVNDRYEYRGCTAEELGDAETAFLKARASGLPLLQTLRNRAWYFASYRLPNVLPINYALTANWFRSVHGRLPRNPARADAKFTDYVYHRMIRHEWSDLERRAADKQYAKEVAAELWPAIKTPRTVEVLNLLDLSEEEFVTRIKSLQGESLVAKTTHGTGDAIFLKKPVDEATIRAMYVMRNWNVQFHNARISLCSKLERKVIIEEELPLNDDFKFFCSRGRVLLLQHDSARFTDHRRALLTPDFELLPNEYTHKRPDGPISKPGNYTEMLAAAAALSAPFEFVRIDLYTDNTNVYLGEFSFTPDGSMATMSTEEFEQALLRQIVPVKTAQPSSVASRR